MKHIYCLAISLVLMGCAHNDAVTFVTSTDVGIDADFTTQNVTIGYSRVEGMHGPVYDTGAIPPIFAKIQTNAKIINPKVSQFYITGPAAEIAAGDDLANHTKKTLTGKRKAMFFGTTTGVGLKARFTSGAPTSLTFGYKRQEYSHIPIIKKGSGSGSGSDSEEDFYGSVLARIEVGIENSKFIDTGLSVGQLFATGRPAELLAENARDIVEIETAKASRSPEVQTLMDYGATEEEAVNVAKGTTADKTAISNSTDTALTCIQPWQQNDQYPNNLPTRYKNLLIALKGDESSLKRQIRIDEELRAGIIEQCTNT